MNNQTESQELDLALLKEVTMKLVDNEICTFRMPQFFKKCVAITQFLQTGHIASEQEYYEFMGFTELLEVEPKSDNKAR